MVPELISDRGDVPKGSAEIFFRKVKFWKGEEGEEAPPVFVGIPFSLPYQFKLQEEQLAYCILRS